jgi:hypothetical protein
MMARTRHFTDIGAVVTWMVWHLENRPGATIQGLRALLKVIQPDITDDMLRRASDATVRGRYITRQLNALPDDSVLIVATGTTLPPDASVTVQLLVTIEYPPQSPQYMQVNLDVPWDTTKAEVKDQARELVTEYLARKGGDREYAIGEINFIGSTYLLRRGARRLGQG